MISVFARKQMRELFVQLITKPGGCEGGPLEGTCSPNKLTVIKSDGCFFLVDTTVRTANTALAGKGFDAWVINLGRVSSACPIKGLPKMLLMKK
jgi:hypothetical protein